MNITSFCVFIGVAVIVLSCGSLEVTGLELCPQCVCPALHDPICAKQRNSGKLRGFSSMCVLDCYNQCFNKKFDFAIKGRCGKLRNPRVTFEPPREPQALMRRATTTPNPWRRHFR